MKCKTISVFNAGRDSFYTRTALNAENLDESIAKVKDREEDSSYLPSFVGKDLKVHFCANTGIKQSLFKQQMKLSGVNISIVRDIRKADVTIYNPPSRNYLHSVDKHYAIDRKTIRGFISKKDYENIVNNVQIRYRYYAVSKNDLDGQVDTDKVFTFLIGRMTGKDQKTLEDALKVDKTPKVAVLSTKVAQEIFSNKILSKEDVEILVKQMHSYADRKLAKSTLLNADLMNSYIPLFPHLSQIRRIFGLRSAYPVIYEKLSKLPRSSRSHSTDSLLRIAKFIKEKTNHTTEELFLFLEECTNSNAFYHSEVYDEELKAEGGFDIKIVLQDPTTGLYFIDGKFVSSQMAGLTENVEESNTEDTEETPVVQDNSRRAALLREF